MKLFSLLFLALKRGMKFLCGNVLDFVEVKMCRYQSRNGLMLMECRCKNI